MIDTIKYLAKLTSSSIFSFTKINLLGAFSTVLVAVIGFILLSKDVDAGHSGHVSAAPFLILLVFQKPLSAILFYATLLGSPFLIFMFGNKYIVSKIIHKLLSDKSEKLIYPIIDKILLPFKNKGSFILKNKENKSTIKDKLIAQLKNENENKWVKKAVQFGLEKAALDKIDFSKEEVSFSEIIKEKTITALQETLEPSRQILWLILAAQWVVLFLVWVLPV